MNRKTTIAGGVAGVLLLCVAFYIAPTGIGLQRGRIFRIGWESDPPFQVRGPDGQPTGFSIELVRAAAQRRDIRLEWVWHPASSEDSLRNNLVDLWPLITITPERKRFIHFSEPYMAHEHYLIVRAASSYWQPRDLARATVAYLNRAMEQRLARGALPEAKLLPVDTAKDSVEAVCKNRSDAAFVEEFSGISTLLTGLSCTDQPLRLIWIPAQRTQLAIGATFGAAAVADQLREEIAEMGQHNELPEIMTRWGYYSPQNLSSMNSLLNATKAKRRLIATNAVFAFLLLLTLLAADRIRRQRNRIEREIARREHAEKELLEWERTSRDLLERAQLVAIMIDLNGRVSFCNEYALSITGWRREEVIGHPAKEILDAVYLSRLAEATEASPAVDPVLPLSERPILTRSGGQRWILWTSTMLRDTNGRPVGFAGLGEDVTEIKRLRTEAAIRESEERFRAIFQDAPVGVAQLDLSYVVTLANDRYHALLGYPEGELVGKNFRDFTHPDDVEPHLAQLRRLIVGELRSFSMEKRYVRKDGAIAHARLHASLVRDQNNAPKHFINILEDISEQMKAATAYLESEERFRNMADTAPVLIWVSGPDKRCTFFNKTWLTFTGKTMEEEIGDGWSKGVHPDDLDRCWTTYASAFDARRTFQMEYRLLSADGTYRWVRDEGVPRVSPDGVFAGYIGSCIDVTDLKRSHQEALARQKLESLGVLAGGIAHDFNNLLGSILADSELAQVELPDRSPGREELARINTVSLRAAEIVRELLVYAGKESATSEPIDISALVDEMLQLLRVSISKHAILKVDLPQNLPATRGNPAQIRQVVMNLITNASESIGQSRGVITVAAGIERIPSDKTTYREADLPIGNYIRLQVSDTGRGMTEDVMARIFDPYFSTKSTGRGLGLAAVQGIVRGHGGKILVKSAPGNGTRIDVLLPALGEPAPIVCVKPEPSLNVEVCGAARTVLIIEDEYALRVPVSKMLRKQGFTVVEVGDGLAAVEVFQADPGRIDVVLLDMTLPGKSGQEVFMELKRIRPDVKVILTSAYSQGTMLPAIDETDVWAFIRKPYRLNELAQLIGRACLERGEFGASASGAGFSS